MSLDDFETDELTAAHNMLAKDGLLTEESMAGVLKILEAGLSDDDIHDMFVVGNGKNGFDLKTWLGAFEHKDHGDQDEEVNAAFACISKGGEMDMDKAKKILDYCGLDLKPKEFDEFKNIADYNSDGKVDMTDFCSMLHATI